MAVAENDYASLGLLQWFVNEQVEEEKTAGEILAMLKAIGVSRWQALGQLLIENGIIGLTGGVISLLPTLLILLLIPSLTQGLVTMPIPYDLVLLMLVMSVLITLGATMVTAWSASGEKPLVALRYE